MIGLGQTSYYLGTPISQTALTPSTSSSSLSSFGEKTMCLKPVAPSSMAMSASPSTPLTTPAAVIHPNTMIRGGAFASGASNAVQKTSSYARTLMQPPFNKRKLILLFLLSIVSISTLLFLSLYTFHRGFRRTVQFWTRITPLVIEFKFLKFKAKYIDKIIDITQNTTSIPSSPEYQRRIKAYHMRTAPKAVTLIQEMGGIYVKIGQLMSTLGSGILDDNYVRALRPLQDGLPPREYEQISSIIEQSTGKRMEDIFVDFETTPVGSASIAQAHRATLKHVTNSNTTTTTNDPNQNRMQGEQVIVKVQYPEVAELFDADLNNLELVTRLFMPENLELVKSLRERHERELDFTIEANNLRECTTNMQRHGVEPSLVRIPRVKNETGICTRHVLVMEYLEGTSLADAITDEQNRFAKAMGRKDADELRSALAKRMREHFERGGGAGDETVGMMGDDAKMKVVQVAGPLAARLFRFYAGVKERVGDVAVGVQNAGVGVVKALTGGKVEPLPKRGSVNRQKKRKGSVAHVNLARTLKTLVHVHGLQFLKDGVYNADPHPGNCLILPDGRIGLIDYGMVGRLSEDDRETVAKVVTALAQKDKKEAARLYADGGYKATWKKGSLLDNNVLHRFATFHFDKIDLSKITFESGERVDTMELLRSVQERAVPDWVEQGRRLCGLLMGVAAQAARPISLAKEWESIAVQSLRQKKKVDEMVQSQ